MTQNTLSWALPSSPPALCCSQPSSSLLCSSFLSLRVLDMGVGRLGESSHVMVTIVTIQWQILRKKWWSTPDPYPQYPYPWLSGRGIADRGRDKPWRTPGLPMLFPIWVIVNNRVEERKVGTLMSQNLSLIRKFTYKCDLQQVFNMGTPNPLDTWIQVLQIQIQMTNSVSMDKSVPAAMGLDHLFSSKILKFLLIFVLFHKHNFFQFYLHCILYNY